MTYNYEDSVSDDIIRIIWSKYRKELTENLDIEYLTEYFHDKMLDDKLITEWGRLDDYTAKQHVTENISLLYEAVKDNLAKRGVNGNALELATNKEISDLFMNNNYVRMDIDIRCFVYDKQLPKALKTLILHYEKAWERFFSEYWNTYIAVHCATDDEAELFSNILVKRGYTIGRYCKGSDLVNPLDRTRWDFKDDCYWYRIDFILTGQKYPSNGYKIIEFKDCLKDCWKIRK